MPNDAAQANVVCPFYHRFSPNGREVICEGIAPGAETCMLFRTRAQRDKWLEALCNTFSYNRCHIAMGVNRKLEQQSAKQEAAVLAAQTRQLPHRPYP